MKQIHPSGRRPVIQFFSTAKQRRPRPMIRSTGWICRVILPALALAILLVITAGPLFGAGVKASPDSPQEILFWHNLGGRPAEPFARLLEQYNASQRRYRVKAMLIPWNSNQKLLVSIAGGIPPDVLMIDRPMAPKWILRGALEDLTPHMRQSGFDPSIFFKVPWEECEYDGRYYMLPLYTSMRCLIYNKRLFREAGLDPERPPRTWQELREYARKLTLRDARGNLRQLGFQGDNSILILLGWQAGGDLASPDLDTITVDGEPYRRGLEFYHGLIEDVGFPNYLRFLSTAGGDYAAQDPFYIEKVAMKLATEYFMMNVRQYAPDVEAAVAPFPMPEDRGPAVTWASGFGVAVPRGSRNPEGAWDFMQFLVSDKAQMFFAREMGLMPARREAAYHPDYYGDPNRRVLVDIIDYSRHYPKVAIIQEVYNGLFNAVESALYGNETPTQALASARAMMQKSLDQYTFRAGLKQVRWAVFYWSLGLMAAAGAIYLLALALQYMRRGMNSRRELLNGYFFASPWLIGFILFLLGPIIVSFIYSFCDYQLLTPARWMGWHNYVELLARDELFWKSLWNTIYYTLFAVPLGIVLALLLALLLNQPIRGMAYFRTIFYLPTLVTGVAVSVLWLWILQPEYGIVNRFLGIFGLSGPLWFQSEQWSKPGLILMSLWGVGGSMLIFLAGLQEIPRHLYEAAEIDGAGPWGRFLYVTLPMLTPSIFFVLVVGIIGSFQVFTQVFVISGGMGGPLNSTLFYVFYLYRKGFEDFQMGYASAMAWILFVIVFLLTLIQFKMAKRWVHY